jgi:Cu2+-exporting ATPase
MSEAPCYHCGLPIPDDVELSVAVGGKPAPDVLPRVPGGGASIVDNGLEDYYRSRDSLPESPREAMPAILEQLALYDHAEFQKSFVKALGESEREASLLLEGITCAACIWLNEQHVGRLPGVSAVDINYTTRRARVRWDESRIKLSDILGAIAAIGYRAYPYDAAAKNEEISRKERRDALWRLWVAGFRHDAGDDVRLSGVYRRRRHERRCREHDALGQPAADAAGGLLFRGAVLPQCLARSRLRRVGMDVPVALGVGAAFAASCWATLAQAARSISTR